MFFNELQANWPRCGPVMIVLMTHQDCTCKLSVQALRAVSAMCSALAITKEKIANAKQTANLDDMTKKQYTEFRIAAIKRIKEELAAEDYLVKCELDTFDVLVKEVAVENPDKEDTSGDDNILGFLGLL